VGTRRFVRSSNAVVKIANGLVIIAACAALTCCGGASTGTKGVVTLGASAASSLAPPPVAVSSSGSCVAEPTESTLSQRSWAFDGTVESIGVTHDSRLGSVPSATFSVHRWFKGGHDEKVTLQYEAGSISEFVPATGPGVRMLVAGDPRWGGQPLDDPVAWGCGFSLPWTDAAERAWAESFAAEAP
jgi:hypothetical protein